MDLTTICVFIIVFLAVRLYLTGYKDKNFPKGPPRIPILGSLPFLKGSGTEMFVGPYILSFGKITGVYAGSYPTVVINDWKLAKDLFSKEIFSARLSNHTTQWARSLKGSNLGVITSDGSRFTSQKNFTVRHLKNFGFGSKNLGSSILRQAEDLVEHLEKEAESGSSKGDVVINGLTFSVQVLNVLWDMVTGETFTRDDQKAYKLLSGFNYLFTSPIFIISAILPWIRFVFPSLTGYNKRLNILKTVQNSMREIIEEHRQTIDTNNPRDLIDCYLMEIDQSEDPEFSEDQLVMICLDLMAAGAETTSTTLIWVVLYLVLYPDIQEKCYKEIQESLGSAHPTLFDLDNLVFCQATICEIQRLSAVGVSSLQHRVTQQVEVEGYTLPKDCLLLSNLKFFMTDPNLWTDPQQFKPERFIDSNGKLFKPEYFVPFGHGRRMCMGDHLAKSELAIFFTYLVQHLKFGPASDGKPLDPDNYTSGFTRVPRPFKVSVTRR